MQTLPPHLQAQFLRDPRYQLAQALRGQASSTAPVQHPMQGIARLGQAYFGKQSMDELNKDYQGQAKQYNSSLASALTGAGINTPAGLPPEQAMKIAQLKATLNPQTKPSYEWAKTPQGPRLMAKRDIVAKGYGPYEKPKAAPAVIQEIDALQGRLAQNPGHPQAKIWQARLDKITSHNPTVTVNNKDNPSLGRYNEARGRLTELRGESRDFEQMLNLIPKVKSGAGAETMLEAKKLAKAIGFDVNDDDIANAEVFRAKAMDFVMARIQQTKGAISEKEMDAFAKASTSLANTPKGNALIVKMGLESVRREEELNKFIANTIRKNPNISVFELDDLTDQFQKDMSERPVFTQEEMATLSGVGVNVGGEPSDLPPGMTETEEGYHIAAPQVNPMSEDERRENLRNAR